MKRFAKTTKKTVRFLTSFLTFVTACFAAHTDEDEHLRNSSHSGSSDGKCQFLTARLFAKDKEKVTSKAGSQARIINESTGVLELVPIGNVFKDICTELVFLEAHHLLPKSFQMVEEGRMNSGSKDSVDEEIDITSMSPITTHMRRLYRVWEDEKLFEELEAERNNSGFFRKMKARFKRPHAT